MAENPVLKRLKEKQTIPSAAPSPASTNTGSASNPVLRSLRGETAQARPAAQQNVINRAPEPVVQSSAPVISDYQKQISNLENQRRQAQVDLDTNTINRIDAELKKLRANAGQQTFADRLGDTVGASASGTVGNVANAAGTLLDILNGKNTNPNSAANRLYGFADTAAEDTQRFTQDAKDGLGKVGQFMVDAGVAGGQLATDIAASALIPGSGLALMGVRGFGGGAQEARQAGATLGQQAAYGAGTAAVSVLSEKLFNIAGPYAKTFGKGFFDKVASKLTNSAAGRVVASALTEGAEEGLESILQPVLQNLTYTDGEKVDWSEVAYESLIGAVLGGLGGGADVIGRTGTRNSAEGSSATIPTASEGSNAPQVKTPQRGFGSDFEGIMEREARRLFGPVVQTAVDAQTERGRATNKMVETIAKNADALAELGVNASGKTASQVRAEVRQALESIVQNVPSVNVEESARPVAETNAENNAEVSDGLGAANAGSLNTDFQRLQAQSSEFHPDGANPARIADVPKFDFNGNPISQSASTVIGSQAIPDVMVPTAEQMVADGLLSYDVVTDASAMQNAENTLLDIGWDGALEKLRNATKNGYVSKDMTVLAERMLVNAANEQNAKQFVDVLAMYQIMRTNVGQAMQAGTMLRKMSPEWQLYGVQRSVANLKAELESKYKKNVPDVQVSEELVGKFLAQQDQAGRDAVMEEIYKDVAQQVPSTWMDKWNAWRYLAMLANPRTHIRNIGGNIGFQPVRIIKNEIAAAVEAALSAFGADIERTKSFAASPAMYRAAWNDFNNARTTMSGNRYESATGKIMQERDIFDFKPLESARKGNSNALEWEDAIFKRITYADSLAQYLKANKVTAAQMESGTVDASILSKARSYAAQEAMKATYQDSNAISDRTEKIVKSMGVFGEAVMPFKRTPANILARALEYSPLGLAKSLTADLVRVRRGDISASQAIDNVASGLTGTGLFSLGMYLFAKGLITPGMGDDEEDKWNQMLGHQGYALELDDGTSVTLDWLAPESLPFFMGVELMSAIGENGFQADDVFDSLASISEPMLELSMLQSVNDMIDNVSYADSNQKIMSLVGSAVISYFSQAIPTIGGQIERSGEEQRMTTYTDKNSALPTDIQYALSKTSAKIPSWDYQQVPYIDAWGRTETTEDPLVRAANNLFNPAYVSQVSIDEVESELQRLYDETGENVFPERAAKYITDKDGNRKDFTADEYVAYAKDLGQTTYNLIAEATKSAEYKKLANGGKVEYLDRVYSYANALAKSKAGGKALSGYQLNAKNAQRDLGVSTAEYLALYEKYGSSYLSGDAYEKTKKAVKEGLTVDEYVEMKTGANTDGKPGVNKEEAMAALNNHPNRVDLWDIINTTGANNPYK